MRFPRIRRSMVPMSRVPRTALICVIFASVGWIAWAQAPPLRRLFVVGTRPLQLVPANQPPPAKSQAEIDRQHGHRHIAANGIPNHKVGQFPQSRQSQRHSPAALPVQLAGRPAAGGARHTAAQLGPPRTAEHALRRGYQWRAVRSRHGRILRRRPQRLELRGARRRRAAGHRHQLRPRPAQRRLSLSRAAHDAARRAELEPVPALTADRLGGRRLSDLCRLRLRRCGQSAVQSCCAAVQLSLEAGQPACRSAKSRRRYDGTFIQDYEYAAGAGDLDECNGRECKTPEFPGGTYAYFLTKDWPVIPRVFRGTPVNLRTPPPRR